MNCRQFEDNLPEYVAGHLSKLDAALMQLHTESCGKCARQEREERALRTRFAVIPAPSAAPDIWPLLEARIAPRPSPPLWQRGWTAAGAFAACAMAAVLFISHPIAPSTVINTPGKAKIQQATGSPQADEAAVVQLVEMQQTSYTENAAPLQNLSDDHDAERTALLGGSSAQ